MILCSPDRSLTYNVAEAGFELLISPLSPLKFWHYRSAPSHLTYQVPYDYTLRAHIANLYASGVGGTALFICARTTVTPHRCS